MNYCLSQPPIFKTSALIVATLRWYATITEVFSLENYANDITAKPGNEDVFVACGWEFQYPKLTIICKQYIQLDKRSMIIALTIFTAFRLHHEAQR